MKPFWSVLVGFGPGADAALHVLHHVDAVQERPEAGEAPDGQELQPHGDEHRHGVGGQQVGPLDLQIEPGAADGPHGAAVEQGLKKSQAEEQPQGVQQQPPASHGLLGPITEMGCEGVEGRGGPSQP